MAYYLKYRRSFQSKPFAYFGELFDDLRNSPESRMHPLVLMTRRILLVCLLVLFASLNSYIILSLMVAIQVLHMILLLGMKPYDTRVTNGIEFTNELFFLFFLVWHFNYNTEAKWTKGAVTAFTGIMMFNNSIVLVLVLSKSLLTSCHSQLLFHPEKTQEEMKERQEMPLVHSQFQSQPK